MKHIELIEKDKAIVSINPKVFPLEVVFCAAYVFVDRAYLIVDGEPKKELRVIIKARKGENAEEIANEFFNQLLNYSVYILQAARNQGVREAIIRRALATNLGENYSASDRTLIEKSEEIKVKRPIKKKHKKFKISEKEKKMLLKDSKGIAEPWNPEKAKGLKKPKF